MITSEKPELAEFSFVISQTEQLDDLAELLAYSLNPEFFNPDQERVTIGIIGSFFAKKSRFVDRAALNILPQYIDKYYLSGYSDANSPSYSYTGSSQLLENQNVELTFEDLSDDKGPDIPTSKPGISFIQNKLFNEIDNLWLGLEIRTPQAPLEEDNYDIVQHAIDVLNRTASPETIADFPEGIARRTVDLFGYATPHLLEERGLVDTFSKACNADADFPALVTMRVYEPKLMHDPIFQRMMDALKQCNEKPENAPNIIEDALEQNIACAL